MNEMLKMAKVENLRYEPWNPQHEIYGKSTRPVARRPKLKKQPYRDYGCDIQGHPSHYYTQQSVAVEWEKIWTKKWIMAGHLNDIPKLNRFMKFDLGKESLIISRGKGDEVRALYNFCPHRGTALVEEDFGSAPGFVCPFHQWAFSATGKLKNIPGRETFREGALCRNLDLRKAHAAVWKGFIFVNLDDDPEPLEDYIGSEFSAMGEAYALERMVRAVDVIQEWPLNWKVAQEAFIEAYHVEAIHPQTVRGFDPYRAQHDVYDNGHSNTIFSFMQPHPAYENSMKIVIDHEIALGEAGLEPDEFPTDWRDVREAVIQGKRKNQDKLGIDYSAYSDDQLVDDWQMGFFPNLTLNLHAEGVLVQRWFPHATDPEKMYYHYQVYALPGARRLPLYMGVPDGAEVSIDNTLPVNYADPDDMNVLGPVLSQDRELMPRVQQGVRSDKFDGPIFSEQEIRLRHFYDEYYKLVGDALDK